MKSIALVFFFISVSVYARPIDVTVKDYGWVTSFPVVRDVLDFYLQGVEDDVNEKNPIIDPSRLNYGTANSTVLAAKGLGTDYANNPENYQISLGAGVAWDAEKDKGLKDEISGIGAASSVTLGARMSRLTDNEKFLGLESKRLMGFLNFGVLPYARELPGEEIDISGKLEAINFGIHFRYDLIEAGGSEMWGWGGLKLHAGYELSKNTIDFTTELDEEVDVDTGGLGILSGRLTGRPYYEIDTLIHSFPVEISSNVFFLKIFSLYGGFGTDFNFGSSEGKGDVKGDVSTLACTSGVCVGETVLPQLEAVANFDARSEVRSVTFRAFAGLQVDLRFGLHAYGQYEQMLGTEVNGVAAGLKYNF